MTKTVPRTRTVQSRLFGPSALRQSLPSATVTSGSFEELRQRIHGSISDAPKIPILPTIVPAEPESESEIKVIDEPVPEPAKPAPASTTEVDAEIITVGRTSNKSRKRKPNTSGASTPQEIKKPRTEVEEFDYTNAPSILDMEGVEEDTSAGGKKREKKKGTFLCLGLDMGLIVGRSGECVREFPGSSQSTKRATIWEPNAHV